jgi:hypothetical protein
MRPERPLEPMRGELSASKVNGKVKKRVKPSPVRARRRLIDPTKWDSVYLKGVFLDNIAVPLPTSEDALESPSQKGDIADEEDVEETDEDSTASDAFSTPPQPVPQLVQDRARAILEAQSPDATFATSSRTHEPTESINVRDEANAALAMLGRMFRDEEEWDGRESVDEMEDLEDNKSREKEMQVDGVGERRKNNNGKGKEKSAGGVVRFDDEDGVEVVARERDVEMEIDPPVSIEVSTQTAEPAPRTNLKALFAPKEDGLSDVSFFSIFSLKNLFVSSVIFSSRSP